MPTMSKGIRYVVFSLISLLFALAIEWHVCAGVWVSAEGVAALEAVSNLGRVRDEAIRDAWRRASEQGVGLFLHAEARVEDLTLVSSAVSTRVDAFIVDYEVVSQEPQAELRLRLKYRGERTRAQQAIHEIRLISKPSRRVFVGKDNIPRPLGGMGICIVSTSQGVMAGHEARQRGIGGEVLLEVK